MTHFEFETAEFETAKEVEKACGQAAANVAKPAKATAPLAASGEVISNISNFSDASGPSSLQTQKGAQDGATANTETNQSPNSVSNSIESTHSSDEIETLSAEYQRTGRIRIESDWAGPIWLVVSAGRRRGHEDGSVYSPDEVAFMVELSARERRILHGFKQQFGGRIELQKNRSDGERPKR